MAREGRNIWEVSEAVGIGIEVHETKTLKQARAMLHGFFPRLSDL